MTTTGSRQAHLEGFDLHANVAVAANNRDGLEQLARYVLRPTIAQERLTRTADGRVLLTLKTEWSDGTTALLFDPIEVLSASRRSRRARGSTLSCPWCAGIAQSVACPGGRIRAGDESRPSRHREAEEPPPPAARKWSWPALMRHTFGVDVLACARCGGRMRV